MKSEASNSRPARRQHDRSFKTDLVQQSLQPGASVAAIALQSGINANLLFKWRREHLRAPRSTLGESAVLLPVRVVQASEVATLSTPNATVLTEPTSRTTRSCVIELEIAGARLRLRGAVDEVMLGSVLRALRRSA